MSDFRCSLFNLFLIADELSNCNVYSLSTGNIPEIWYCVGYICIYYLQCNELDDVDVQIASTPAEVINECDITLACLSDSFAVKEVTAMSTYPTERKTAMSTYPTERKRTLESYFAKFGTVEIAKNH